MQERVLKQSIISPPQSDVSLADNFVYVMLSQTQSGFGRMIRKVTGNTYNHSSIAFDAELKHLYGFGRLKNRVPVVAGLVREYPERFTLNKVDSVPVVIYRIPVTRQQYQKGIRRVKEILNDPEVYLYNLFSVLTYPLFKGFRTYKAYTCSEFVVHILGIMGVKMNNGKSAHKYTPEQLMEVLRDYEIIYEGNLLDYVDDATEHIPTFFESPDYVNDSIATVYTLARLVYRSKASFGSLKTAFYRYTHYFTG